ncbi:MAG: L,D-transpeptidase family protein [Pseudomonadota bacterium]|nr:L,D-transpeptidase family protein [Pseudomonadota bacterium]
MAAQPPSQPHAQPPAPSVSAAPAPAPAPSWFEAGRPGAQARQAVELLASAATHGLEPQDYNASALQQAIAKAAQGPVPPAVTVARLEQALSTAMERYLADVHQGRVDPQKIHHNFNPKREAFDPAAYLQAALTARRLPQAASEAAPRLPQYAQLRTALARYRQLGDDPAWSQPLPSLPGGKAGKLAPGQAYPGLAVLAQRLAALGDLAPDVALPARYEGALVEAVKSFQKRHGLGADGVIGKATLAQLEVKPAARARQIELALERLRWTPLKQGPRMIVINLPEFVLRAYEVKGDSITVLEEMKVVVGKALDTRTPLFDEDMRFIEFSPYWNIPPSIARAETVPTLRRDPGYLAREGMEFVLAGGAVSTAVTPAHLDAVLAGQARIRQRPGPKNALGDIKFVFPNRDNIFLHHTPSPGLFERERRDFSHGCIRVEEPVALARFVLKGMPDWTEERIHQAMTRGASNTLRLTEPIPVLIAYGTTLVKDGQTYFFQDIYGLDRQLDAALRQRAQPASSNKD